VSDSQLWERVQYSPHRSHYALEPDEEHRRCKMDGLVRLVAIALGGLACTEEREERALEVELHQAGHGQDIVITEMKRALEWLAGVLQPVACNVHQVRGWERRRRFRGLRHELGRGSILDPGFLNNRADVCRLHFDFAERGQTCVGGVLGGDEQELCVSRPDWLEALARAQESGERGCVRGDDVVGATFLVVACVDASRVDWNVRKFACGAPVEPRSLTHVLLFLQGSILAMCGYYLWMTNHKMQTRQDRLDHIAPQACQWAPL
jgi:hypothetical protein